MPVDNQYYNRPGDIWWDEQEVLNTLRTWVNPGRFGYAQEVLLQKLQLDPAGKKTLDVGCGGGILAEEFARLGCVITGIDPSEASIITARKHAQASGLQIDYHVGVGEDLPYEDNSFDIVYCCDVLEHVNNLEKVIAEIHRVLKKDGVFLFDTINRTLISNLVTIKVLQEWKATSVMPPNLHDWHMFIKPRELQAIMSRHGLVSKEFVGLAPRANPLKILSLLLKRKRNQITFKEIGESIGIKKSWNSSNLYAGYAIKIN